MSFVDNFEAILDRDINEQVDQLINVEKQREMEVLKKAIVFIEDLVHSIESQI